MAQPQDQGQGKAWCFTVNNPVHKSLWPNGLPAGIKYLVYQVERGENGTEHLQGYISFASIKRRGGVAKVTFLDAEEKVVMPFATAHLLRAKGNAAQNKAYCTKADTRIEGPWELGESKQGERTDLQEAADKLVATGDVSQVDNAIFLKYPSGCLKLAARAQPPRRDNLTIITLIGGTGIGKSYSVHDLYPDVYVVNMGNSGLWWDGYTGQKAVLFEEFKGQVQLQKMLQILDPYPLRLEVKGGTVNAKFTIVFITSNYAPYEWYRNDDGRRGAELDALKRRLGSPTEYEPDGQLRYIHVDTRDKLHMRLDAALSEEKVEPKPAKKLYNPDATADKRPLTPALADEDCGAPTLKRHNAQIIVC